ncbi:MAG: isochorismatase family protein [Ancrocorticia sp.]
MSINRVLVVVDVQQEYFDGPLRIQYPTPEIVRDTVVTAIAAARAADVPVVLIEHENPASAVAFATGSERQKLHPRLETFRDLPRFAKNKASVFTSGEFVEWLVEHDITVVTLAGFMTNNCLLASAAAAEPLDYSVEILRDASGTINLVNEAGTVEARQLHETLMVLLHSNWAAVTRTDRWIDAINERSALTRSNLIVSASQTHEDGVAHLRK